MLFFTVIKEFVVTNNIGKRLCFDLQGRHSIYELEAVVNCGLGSTLTEVINCLSRAKYIKEINPPDLYTLVKTALLFKLQEK